MPFFLETPGIDNGESRRDPAGCCRRGTSELGGSLGDLAPLCAPNRLCRSRFSVLASRLCSLRVRSWMSMFNAALSVDNSNKGTGIGEGLPSHLRESAGPMEPHPWLSSCLESGGGCFNGSLSMVPVGNDGRMDAAGARAGTDALAKWSKQRGQQNTVD
jgi:hypothetical protein